MIATTSTSVEDDPPGEDAPGPPAAAPDAPDTPGGGVPAPARRRWARAWAIGSVLAVAFFVWLVTAGTGELLVEERVGDFHDVQVRAWLDGHWDVPAEELTIEGFVTDGRTYLYFGPVPALMRLPVLALTDAFDGRLSRVSLLGAFTVAMASCGVLGWRTRRLLRGDEELTTGEVVAVGATAVLIGTGSILPFYASRAWVYHETTLWAVAYTLAAFAALVGHLQDRRVRSLIATAVLALAAMLTRGSVGVAPAVAVGFVGAGELIALVRRRPGVSIGRVAALGLVAVLPFVAFSTVNMIKFRSLWSLPLDRQVITSDDSPGGEARRAAMDANGGTLFGVKFIPTTALHYVRPDVVDFRRTFPWLGFHSGARMIGPVVFDTIDPASSVTANEPALVVLGALGLVGIARRRSLRPLVPLLGGAAAGAFTVLTIGFIAHRYLGDLFPLLAVAALCGLALAPTLRVRRWVRAGGVGLVGALGVWSAWVSTALTLDYQGFLIPNPENEVRASLVRTQVAIGPRSAFDVRRVDELGPVGPMGSFAVIGDCDGLYRSDGARWAPVERTPTTGRFLLRATFRPGPPGTTVRVLDYPDAKPKVPLVLHWLEGGRARFESVDLLGLRNLGRTFEVGDGPRSVEVLADPRTTEVIVYVDGERVLDSLFHFLPHEQLTPTRDWASEIEARPPDVRACRQLVGESS